MRLIAAGLLLLLLSVSAWAGTYKDDFEDGNWQGWKAVATLIWDTSVADEVSVVDGVLRLDHLNGPGFSLTLGIEGDWKNYSFSADMRLIEIDPGAH